MTDNTKRFSDRVANYVQYRPGYPAALLPFLQETLALPPQAQLADIGSGTGKLTELFLEAGYAVTGVEPNDEMRLAGEKLLAHYPAFTSVNGTAEHTTLPDHAFDLVLAGQAFHWFDQQQAGVEFRRINKETGWVALIWNERNSDSPFLADYEQFLYDYSNNYAKVNHRHIDKAVFDAFFGEGNYGVNTFTNYQDFDFTGLAGRYQSSSYAYTETHPGYPEAMEKLGQLFGQYAQNGLIRFEYLTNVNYGRLG